MTTLFLARRRAPDDLHPRSGVLTDPAEDLRRISFDVGTRFSACNCNRATDERERQPGTHEDKRFMIVLRCIRSRLRRVPRGDGIPSISVREPAPLPSA